MQRKRIGFVTGLAAEAQLLAGTGFPVMAGGGTPAGAYAAAQRLLEEGAWALVSFGLAGGLKPGHPAGTLLVPTSVREGTHDYPCDYALMEFLGGATGAPILAGHKIAESRAEKQALFEQTGVPDLDLESGAVARAATEKNVPFAVLRAVADPADRDLPPAAMEALDEDGRILVRKVLCALLRAPGQLPDLIAVGRDAAKARAALKRRVAALGSDFEPTRPR